MPCKGSLGMATGLLNRQPIWCKGLCHMPWEDHTEGRKVVVSTFQAKRSGSPLLQAINWCLPHLSATGREWQPHVPPSPLRGA